MKHLTPAILFFLLLGVSCFSGDKQIIYRFEKNADVFEFESTAPDTVIKHSVRLSSYEFYPNKDKPLKLGFIFSEWGENAQRLKFITAKISGRDENGKISEFPSEVNLEIEYYNGKTRKTVVRKNYKDPLAKLVNWKAVNYEYEFQNVKYVTKRNPVTYKFNYEFRSPDYPDTLYLTLDLVWENGVRKYETLLHKKDYEGPGLSLKY
jgi:hypothetical protein